MWKKQGKPRQGPVFEIKKRTNACFKYALRYINNNEDSMRRDALATKLQTNNVEGFWKEVKLIDNSNTPLPTNIEGMVGSEKIAELWKSNYKELFNCICSNIKCYG